VKLYSLHTDNLHKVANTVDSCQNVGQSGDKECKRLRTRSASKGSPGQLVAQAFGKEAVVAALHGFDQKESAVVYFHFGNSNLVEGCHALKQSTETFMSHNGSTIKMEDMRKLAPWCTRRIEQGLQVGQKELKAAWLTELVEKHFAHSALKDAWDTVIAEVQAKWPTRSVQQVLMVTGDCSGLLDSEDLFNVVFGKEWQRVRCHWDGFHVVCFVVEGDKRFLTANRGDFPPPAVGCNNRNVNERHDIDPFDVQNSAKFKEAHMSGGHVLFMKAGTLHEVCRAVPQLSVACCRLEVC
jgi:hypothetical protein